MMHLGGSAAASTVVAAQSITPPQFSLDQGRVGVSLGLDSAVHALSVAMADAEENDSRSGSVV